MALLTLPLQSAGWVEFCAPDSLFRMTTAPTPAAILLQGDTFRVRSGERTHRAELGDHPGARELVSALVDLLQGRVDALMRTYKMEVSGSKSGWKLRLAPRSVALREWISGWEFEGKARRLVRMRLREANGDETTTQFTNVALNAACRPAELLQRFEGTAHERSAPASSMPQQN